MKDKVLKLLGRFNEVEGLLGQPEVLNDQKRYKALTQEHSYLSELKNVWQEHQSSKEQLKENKELVSKETDPEFLEVIKDEIKLLEKSVESLYTKLETLIVPPDPTDHANTIVELRAGTGGDEAAIFVGDCTRMYQLYADKMGWSWEKLSSSPSEMGGFKEYIMGVTGQNVYRFLKHEAGTHRVQRVPTTETQGRVHTSAITVAVLNEPEADEEIKIDEKELKIDTYRASGAGGQHVNTTDSAVRITHLPTNTAVYCQEERSQHKNKDKAMRLLKARLTEVIKSKKDQELSSLRLSQVGSGDRSERIRTYNFPQNRVTDHRINLTLYKLDQAIQGELEILTGPLVAHYHQKRLSQ